MKDLIGAGVIFFMGAYSIMISMPGYIPPEVEYGHLCPDSKPVIVDGEFMECTDDKSQDPANTWTP